MYDEWGIADGYYEVNGTWHDTPDATRDHLRAAIGETPETPPMWFIHEGSTHTLHDRCHLTLEDGDEWGEIDSRPALAARRVSPVVTIGWRPGHHPGQCTSRVPRFAGWMGRGRADLLALAR